MPNTTRMVEAFEVSGNIKKKLRTVNIDDSLVNTGVIPNAVKAYVTAVEKGDGIFRQTIFTLSSLPVTITDTNAYAGIQIYTMPAGMITPVGAVATVAVTTTSALVSTLNAESACHYGVGSAVASNITLATTMQNFLNTTAFTSSATVNVASAAASGYGIGIVTPVNGTSTSVPLYLNLAVDDAGNIDADATVTVSGTITITYVVLGDY